MALKLRRGLQSARTGITPEAGEIIYTTDDNKIYVGDGTTAGGDLVAGQKGEVGAAGAAGSKGQKGEVGVTGSAGSAGSKGQKGEVGVTGSAGSAGSKGQKGEVGVTGSAGSAGADGAKGQKGESVTGAAGSKGQKGEVGVTGTTGTTGTTGAAGSAGSAGAAGAKGEVGLGFNVAKSYASVSALTADTTPNSGVGFNQSLKYTVYNPTPNSTDRFANVTASGATYFATSAYDASTPKIYVYSVSTGALLHTISNSSTDAGQSLAIDGNYLIVGGVSGWNGANPEIVLIYDISTFSSSAISSPTYTLNNPNVDGVATSSYPDSFGQYNSHLAISGNMLAIGAASEYGSPSVASQGKVYVYDISTFGSSTITSANYTLTNPNSYGTASADHFGNHLAMDGDNLIVGVNNEDSALGDEDGVVYYYDMSAWSGSTATPTYTIVNPNADSASSAGDNYGIAVAISGSKFAVCANGEDTGGFSAGAVYIHNVSNGALTHTIFGPVNGGRISFGRDVLLLEGNDLFCSTKAHPLIYIHQFDISTLSGSTTTAASTDSGVLGQPSGAASDDQWPGAASFNGTSKLLVTGAMYADQTNAGSGTLSNSGVVRVYNEPTAIATGEFALIETGDVEDADNSKLYLWNGSAYSYVSDLSGEAGVTGVKGQKGESVTGSAGSAGAKGQKGEVGVTGTTGSNGSNGSAGTKGQKGEAASGSSTFSALTEIALADLDVHDIAVPASSVHVVTPNGSSAYRSDIHGTSDNPSIYVDAGETLAFDLTGLAGSHPFEIRSDATTAYNTGLIHIATDGTRTTGTNAQGKTSGTLYWKVPGSISGTYKYICTSHSAMIGDIVIADPSAVASGGGDSQKSFTSSGTVAAATAVILNGSGTVSEVSVSAAAFSSSSDSIDVITSSTYESNNLATFDYIWDSYNDQYIALNIGIPSTKILYGQVVTVNKASNTMTAGSQQTIHSGIYGTDVMGVDLGGGKILICYRAISGYVSAAVITNTGGTLSLGSVVSLQTMQTGATLQRIMDLCTDPDTGTSYLLMGFDSVNANPRILSITVSGTTPALASSADMQADQVSINSYGRTYDSWGSQDCRIFWNSTHSKILVVDLHLRKSTVCTVSGTTVTVPNSIALASGTNTTYKGRAIEYHPYLGVYMVVIQDGSSNAPVHMMHATFDGTTFSYPTSSSQAFTISGTGHSQRIDNQIITSSVNAGIAVISCRGEYEYKANMGTYAIGSSSYTSISANQIPTPMIYNKTWMTRGAQDISGNISFAGFYGGTDAQSRLKIAVGRLAASSTKSAYIGIAQAAVADATAVTVMLPGGISTGHTGLTAKSTYYLADDGALTATVTTVKAGVAIDATTLQVADTLGGLAVNLLSYATKANPALTGIPTAPTADAAINTTQLATTAYVTTAVAAGATTFTAVTGSITMASGSTYILDTSSAITLTLPASATLGDKVGIIDGSGASSTNNITVARNGHKIQGLTQDMTIGTNRSALELVYYNVVNGWLLTNV